MEENKTTNVVLSGINDKSGSFLIVDDAAAAKAEASVAGNDVYEVTSTADAPDKPTVKKILAAPVAEEGVNVEQKNGASNGGYSKRSRRYKKNSKKSKKSKKRRGSRKKY